MGIGCCLMTIGRCVGAAGVLNGLHVRMRLSEFHCVCELQITSPSSLIPTFQYSCAIYAGVLLAAFKYAALCESTGLVGLW